jgi:hypothetical protein
MAPAALSSENDPGSVADRLVRWALSPLLMLSAGYACLVVAREVLWVLQEREPLTALTGLALAYVAVFIWTTVWVAITIWIMRSARPACWWWATVLPLPGLAFLGVSLLHVHDWGGPLDADFGQGVALAGALLVLLAAGLYGLLPHLTRSMRRRGDDQGREAAA